MKQFRRRMPVMLFAASMLLLLGACGRVNLEELTPAAVRTEIAMRPTATPVPTPDPSAPTPGPGGPRTGEGNRAAGSSLYNAQCSGCHEGRRAESLRGKSFVFEEVQPWMRGEQPGPENHPTYRIDQLTDNNIRDILFYLETEQS
jgi:mono/diheme cytochrome c family protein